MKPASTQNRIDLTVTPIVLRRGYRWVAPSSPALTMTLQSLCRKSRTPGSFQFRNQCLLETRCPVTRQAYGSYTAKDSRELLVLPFYISNAEIPGRILPHQAFLFDFTIKSSVALSRLLSPLLAQNRTLKKNASCKSYSISEQLPYFFVSNVLRPKPFNYFLTRKIDEN